MDYERGGHRAPDQNQRQQRYGKEETTRHESGRSKAEEDLQRWSNSRRERADSQIAGVGERAQPTYGEAYWNLRPGWLRINYIEFLQTLKDEGVLRPSFRIFSEWCTRRYQEAKDMDGNTRGRRRRTVLSDEYAWCVWIREIPTSDSMSNNVYSRVDWCVNFFGRYV